MSRFTLTAMIWHCVLAIVAAQDASVFNQVIGSTGRVGTNQGRSYAYTVGEVVIQTGISAEHFLTQGFHQPEHTLLVSVGAPELTDWDIRVFPNPVSDLLTIRYAPEKGSVLSATVLDAVGRVVLTNHPVLEPTGTALDCRSWQPGIYFLVLTDPLSRASATTRVIRL